MAATLGVALTDYRVAWQPIDERIEKGSWAPQTDDRWTDLYGPLVQALGLPISPNEVAARFSNLFRSTDAYAAFSDVALALRGLVETGFRLGVLSNSDFPLEPILERCGIGEFIYSAVPAVGHGTTKPHPEAFLLGTDALGVQRQDCWFVGDRLIDDVTASAALGMKPVLVDRTGRYASVGLSFPRIHDLSLLQMSSRGRLKARLRTNPYPWVPGPRLRHPRRPTLGVRYRAARGPRPLRRASHLLPCSCL